MRFLMLSGAALLLALPASAAAPIPATTVRPDVDAETLRQAGLPVDARSVQKYLRDRCGTEADADRIAALVRQLGASEFKDREDAAKRLVAFGTLALPHLHLAQRDRDPEVADRANKCIAQVTRRRQPHLLSAAVRRVVRQRADGAVATLLRFLPYAVEQQQQEDVWFGLDALATQHKALDPTIEIALRDRLAVRRAASAYVLGRRGKQREQQLARKALADSDPAVRLRAAQGLLGRQDKAGVAVLIDLLRKSDVAVAWQAEELLHWLAGETGPEVTVGSGSAEARKKCRAEWKKWWHRHGDKVDPDAAMRTYRRPGLMLVHEVDADVDPREGSLWVGGCDGRARWRIAGLGQVRDAHWLPSGRLLLAEISPAFTRPSRSGKMLRLPSNYGLRWEGGVTERDLGGKIAWKYEGIEFPSSCGRLADGTTVVLSGGRVAEVTHDGKRIFHRDWGVLNPEISRTSAFSQRLPSGDFLFRKESRDGELELIELERQTEKIRQRIRLKDRVDSPNLLTQIEVLTNGNYLVTGGRDGIIREVDAGGGTVWRSPPLRGASGAWRLRSNSVLVAQGFRVVELRRGGQVVWEAFRQKGMIREVWPLLNLVQLGFDNPRPDGFDLDRSVAYRVKGLKNKEARVRFFHASLLGQLGAKSESAVPALLNAQNDPDAGVRRIADNALEQVTSAASLPTLLRGTKDGRAQVRTAACRHLWKYSDQGVAPVSALLACLSDDRDVEVRRAAAQSLRNYKAHADRVVPALVLALEDSDPGETRILTSHGDTSRTAVPHYAVRSLGFFQMKARAAIPGLLRAAKSDDPWLRRDVMHAFGSLSLPAPAIEKALQDGVRDENKYVRAAATASLKRFRKLAR